MSGVLTGANVVMIVVIVIIKVNAARAAHGLSPSGLHLNENPVCKSAGYAGSNSLDGFALK
jgi:hypothetical protein